MKYNHVTGIKHVVQAAKFSLAGFQAAFRYEEAFRIELMLFILLAPLGLWLGDSGLERAVLVGSLIVVLITELLNSAVETAIDRIGEERHKLSGRAKDIGSAAVMVSLINVLFIWAVIVIPKLSL